jgi:class 3 adenylate cyclase
MFSDLVGSTTLSARLDPEDMREVIRAYQDACSGAVARYDGFVAKFMGDGVVASISASRACEEDAERAVRAGLDIAAVVAKLETRANENLNVRIGIATGIVVGGDLVGLGSAQEQAVVGETPNLAARLQALAESGRILIAESTKRLLGGAFELEPLGPQPLKGFDAPVLAWTILREAENITRFEASRSQRLTPFIGREHEVALLLDRWRDASGGEGQVALITGEAGIGKSCILTALSERIDNVDKRRRGDRNSWHKEHGELTTNLAAVGAKAAGASIKSWKLDAAAYTPTPVMADGRDSAPLELRELFARYTEEMRD